MLLSLYQLLVTTRLIKFCFTLLVFIFKKGPAARLPKTFWINIDNKQGKQLVYPRPGPPWKPILPSPVRIRGSIGSITRATRVVISRHNAPTSNTWIHPMTSLDEQCDLTEGLFPVYFGAYINHWPQEMPCRLKMLISPGKPFVNICLFVFLKKMGQPIFVVSSHNH